MTSTERIRAFGEQLLQKRHEVARKAAYFCGYRQALLDVVEWINDAIAKVDAEIEQGESAKEEHGRSV